MELADKVEGKKGIMIGCEVPDINYFLMLIKHYFFSQFYNYKKNKSLQIKAFIVNLNPDTDVERS
jgi:hypothetical protein